MADLVSGISGNIQFPTYEFILNIFAVIISLLAVIFWTKLYKRVYTKDILGARGWTWLFVGVLGILLFNISSIYLLFSKDPVYEMMATLGRTIIGISMTIGAYLLYAPMKKGLKYGFVAVSPVMEARSKQKIKHRLEPGKSYIVTEEIPVKSNEIFLDLVTHGIPGLYVTRKHPDRIRDAYGLEKTPIIWLTREKSEEKSIPPGDLVELSHTIKEFIKKTKESVIFLDGVEYLIVQNGYEEMLKFLQSLDDSIAVSNSRLIMPLDPSTLDSKQLHLLKREMSILRADI